MQFCFSIVLLILTAATCIIAAPSFSAASSTLQTRGSRSGEASFYDTGLGSCGETNSDDEMVVALPSSLMHESNGNLCGRYITVNSSSGSVTVKVVDTCSRCLGDNIEMSQAAFRKLGSLASGHIPVSWSL